MGTIHCHRYTVIEDGAPGLIHSVWYDKTALVQWLSSLKGVVSDSDRLDTVLETVTGSLCFEWCGKRMYVTKWTTLASERKVTSRPKEASIYTADSTFPSPNACARELEEITEAVASLRVLLGIEEEELEVIKV